MRVDAHLTALAMEHDATSGTFYRHFQQFSGLRVDWLGQN